MAVDDVLQSHSFHFAVEFSQAGDFLAEHAGLHLEATYEQLDPWEQLVGFLPAEKSVKAIFRQAFRQ